MRYHIFRRNTRNAQNTAAALPAARVDAAQHGMKLKQELIEEKILEKQTEERIRLIPTETVFPGELFVRTEYDPRAFGFLCASIAQYGIVEPLVVIKIAAGYRIISGDRRYYAARHLKMTHLPCVVRKEAPPSLELLLKASSKSLSPFDKAEALRALGGTDAADGLYMRKQEAEELLKLLDFSLKERLTAENAGLGREVLSELLKVKNKNKRAKLLEKAAKERLSPREIRIFAKEKRRIRGAADIRLVANSAKKLCEEFSELGVPLEVEIKKDGVTIRKRG